MPDGQVEAVLRETMLVIFKLGGPVLLAALAMGVVMSLFQAVTQINEPTLAFVPKALAIGATLVLSGPFVLATITDFARGLIDQMIVVGGL